MAAPNRNECSDQSRNRLKNGIKSISKIDLKRITLFLVLISNIHTVESSEVNETKIDDDIPRRMKIVEAIAGRSFFSDVYENGTFRTGNSLWDNLLNKCTVNPSVSCVQNNVYSYLDEKLEYAGDINFGGVCFKKNNVDVRKYSKEANIIYLTGRSENERSLDEENEINDDEESGKANKIYLAHNSY